MYYIHMSRWNIYTEGTKSMFTNSVTIKAMTAVFFLNMYEVYKNVIYKQIINIFLNEYVENILYRTFKTFLTSTVKPQQGI